MSITRRKDGRAMQTVTIEGKRKTFYSSEASDKKAEKEIRQKIIDYTKNAHLQKHNFLELAEKMLSEREKSVSYKSMECYRTALNHLARFYDKNIEEITASAAQSLLDDLAAKNYSYSAVQKVKTTFGMILSYAISEDLPISDYRRVLRVPRNAKKGKVSSPDDEVIDAITKNALKTEWGMWAMCLLCTGYRRGELAAVQRKAIDFDNDVIYFLHSVEFVHNRPVLKKGAKTESGNRDIPILNILKPFLYEMVKDMKPDEFIFGGEKPLSETQIKKRWKKYCGAIGYTFNGHQLRHAYAKLLYRAGVDVKTAQKLLGHADIQTTMNIYTDFSEDVTKASIDKINSFTDAFFK